MRWTQSAQRAGELSRLLEDVPALAGKSMHRLACRPRDIDEADVR